MTLKIGGPCVKETSQSSTARPQEKTKQASMTAWGLLHRRELLGAGGALKFRRPGLVRHAIDRLAALVPAERHALGVGFLFHPVRQAVAAEARQIHQVDVLDVGARTQMFDQAPE